MRHINYNQHSYTEYTDIISSHLSVIGKYIYLPNTERWDWLSARTGRVDSQRTRRAVDDGWMGAQGSFVPAHPSLEKIEGWGTLGGGPVKISKA
jgi:hypothetical protein